MIQVAKTQHITGVSFINGKMAVTKDFKPLVVQLDIDGRRQNLEQTIARAKRVLEFKRKSGAHPQGDVSNLFALGQLHLLPRRHQLIPCRLNSDMRRHET